MTTIARNPRNDTVLLGFFALIGLAIAVRTFFAGNTIGVVIGAVIFLACTALAIRQRRQPPPELRIDEQAIVLAHPKRELGRITRDESGGNVTVAGWIRKGHLYAFLVRSDQAPPAGLPLDGFDGAQVADACASHGWNVTQTRP